MTIKLLVFLSSTQTMIGVERTRKNTKERKKLKFTKITSSTCTKVPSWKGE
jgi:hypothetical protein